MKPRIGILPGDPGGIGPELVAKVLDDQSLRDRARILLIGDKPVFDLGQTQANVRHELERVDSRSDVWTDSERVPIHHNETIDPGDIRVGGVARASGRSSLANLDLALGPGTRRQD